MVGIISLLGLSVGGLLWLYSFSLSRQRKWIKGFLGGWFIISWFSGSWCIWVYFKHFSGGY
jgi:hypothetical protein